MIMAVTEANRPTAPIGTPTIAPTPLIFNINPVTYIIPLIIPTICVMSFLVFNALYLSSPIPPILQICYVDY